MLLALSFLTVGTAALMTTVGGSVAVGVLFWSLKRHRARGLILLLVGSVCTLIDQGFLLGLIVNKQFELGIVGPGLAKVVLAGKLFLEPAGIVCGLIGWIMLAFGNAGEGAKGEFQSEGI